MTEFDREAARRAIDTAHQMVAALCEGAREWVMSIPARPDHDPDLIIADGLEAGKKALSEIDRLRKEREDLVAAVNEHFRMRNEYRDRASRAEAKVEEMAKALRAARGWLAKVDAPNGDDFLNDDGWDELRAALSQRSEIEPGRPAADAPDPTGEGDSNVG